MELSRKISIEDVNVVGKRVLVRVDFNVPLKNNGETVANDARLVASLPTIHYLLQHGAKAVILMSHLGRPDGKIVPSASLRPVAAALQSLLNGKPVKFLSDCVGPDVEAACAAATDGEIILLENLRFHIEEEGAVKLEDGTKIKATEEQISTFRVSLSRLGDIYVNDAFGTVHRAHSSIVGINLETRASGLLVKKELNFFAKALEGPDRMDIAIVGGSKISDKILLIQNLLKKVKHLIIGSGMAFTFLKVTKGMSIGKSLFDQNGAELVPKILEEAQRQNAIIHLPEDFVIASAFSNDAETRVIDASEDVTPDSWLGLDIGPKSAEKFATLIRASKMILWNGPVGVFEMEKFAAGTKAVLDAMIDATKNNSAVSIVGGGDSAAAVAKWNAESELSHVSTGGGASLELLEGKTLPGIVSLSNRN